MWLWMRRGRRSKRMGEEKEEERMLNDRVEYWEELKGRSRRRSNRWGEKEDEQEEDDEDVEKEEDDVDEE